MLNGRMFKISWACISKNGHGVTSSTTYTSLSKGLVGDEAMDDLSSF